MTTRREALALELVAHARTQGLGGDQRVLMTLRVSRDSGRTWGQVKEVLEDEDRVILDSPCLFPACTCPRCTDRFSRAGVASRTGS